MKKLLPFLALLFILTSCNDKNEASLTKTSADGKTVVKVYGKRSSSLEPFQVTTTVKSGDIPEGSLIFEIFATDLNDSNVRFDWSDSRNAVITFTQKDGEKKIFKLTVSDTNVILAPVL
jgi:hypothetical protein